MALAQRLKLGRFTAYLKVLAVIPVTMGLVTLLEGQFPNHIQNTRVVSKSESYRAKTDRTTYTITFEHLNDQFTEEIYNAFNEGDEVQISMTFVHKQIRSIVRLRDGQTFENTTGEPLALFAFGLAFILAGLSWLKRGLLSDNQAFYLTLIVLFSFISLLRVILV